MCIILLQFWLLVICEFEIKFEDKKNLVSLASFETTCIYYKTYLEQAFFNFKYLGTGAWRDVAMKIIPAFSSEYKLTFTMRLTKAFTHETGGNFSCMTDAETFLLQIWKIQMHNPYHDLCSYYSMVNMKYLQCSCLMHVAGWFVITSFDCHKWSAVRDFHCFNWVW